MDNDDGGGGDADGEVPGYVGGNWTTDVPSGGWNEGHGYDGRKDLTPYETSAFWNDQAERMNTEKVGQPIRKEPAIGQYT